METDLNTLTARELSNRISGCRTQLKRHTDGPRRLELERYLERLLHAREDAPLYKRLHELEARIDPMIDSIWRYLRDAQPTMTTSDRRVRRQLTDADRAKTHAIGQGDYVDTSGWLPIRTITLADARRIDRERAEELLHRRASTSAHPGLQRVKLELDEIDEIRAELNRRQDARLPF